ncbi:MAG TPA: molybdopterin cofactor-binding domain-containing protein [Candidatus Limnocylindrales bacterium]|nr:molybdopterin cofactor-binding domain-containing protein [Candidatus Limnocylindrales bacterium]
MAIADEEELRVVGHSLMKPDAMGKVSGQTRFADDLALPRMLYGRLLRSPVAHARIVAIDVSRARALAGVSAVLTGADLPEKFGILPVSQDEEALAGEKVRYVGDPIAAVAAADEWIAEDALNLIDVRFEELPRYMSLEEAIRGQGEPIHGRSNVHKAVALEFADSEAAIATADHVREDLVFFEGNTHLPMEQHAALAQYGQDGKLTLWSSTQTPHYVHRALGKVLGIPMSRIRVIATPNGGGFGGKSDIFSHELVAAKLAMVTGRPVKITLSREEVFYAHRGRHPVLMKVRTGLQRDGRIAGMQFTTFLDGGAYGSYGVASTYYTGALQPATYAIPAYRFQGVRLFTNKPPCGPKRGHGTPQPRFALEVHLDKLAEELGIDPVTLRLRNLPRANSRTINWLRITSCGLRECIERVVAESRFRERWKSMPPGRGLGFAVSAYLSGAGTAIYWNDMPHSEVQLKLDRNGGVAVLCGAIDIGQGSDHILAAIVAEVLGVSLDDIQLTTADTDLTPIDLGSYSSRVTFMAGNAAKTAAERARGRLFEVAARVLHCEADELVARDRRIFRRDRPEEGIAFAQAVQAAEAEGGVVATTGSYTPPRLAGPYKGSGVGPSPAYSYSAAVVEVECDARTGEVRVVEVWIAHDIGRAINPVLVEGQVEGSVYMALGEALMEEQVFRLGVHKFPSMLDYKSPTALETPVMHTYLIETIDREGPFGAKEAGQGPLLPVIPAVANAVYNALGVRIDEIPITPDKVLRALAEKARGRSPRVGPAGIPAFAFPPLIKAEIPDEWKAR